MPRFTHRPGTRLRDRAGGFAAAALLGACATPSPHDASASAGTALPARWHAPVPPGGATVDPGGWWAQFDDPLLPRLVAASRQASASLAQARARIADARAAHTAGRAALWPKLDAAASAERGVATPGADAGAVSVASVGLQASWELDLFGAYRAAATAAQARLQSSQAAWHGAQVALGAEVANAYVDLRACEAQVAQLQQDAESRAQTAQLTALAADAGFQAPAAAALARASAAQGNAALARQRMQCETAVKALVALTAFDEPALRRELAERTAQLPQPAALRVASLPATALARRPDIALAAAELEAASADADAAEARRWPRITLAGRIGHARESAGGVSTDGRTWSVGPVAVTLPLFDAGVRRADATAARARHDAARVAYTASLRTAVREVETALVTLHGAAARGDDVRHAAAGFEHSYRATAARFRGGLASLFELEDARRSVVAARGALVEQQRESVLAWIDTYRALGGGWSAEPGDDENHDNPLSRAPATP